MSYLPDKAIPLAVATLEEVTKLISRKDQKANDTVLEKIFIDLYKEPMLKANDIDEMLFRLHAASNNAIAKMKTATMQEIALEEKMSKEFTYEETSKELGISYRQVKKLVKLNQLNAKHYSARTVRITFSEIERYRKENYKQ